jgi:hypothetical protein
VSRSTRILILLLSPAAMVIYGCSAVFLVEQAWRFAAADANLPARFRPSINIRISHLSLAGGGIVAGLFFANLWALRLAQRNNIRRSVVVFLCSLVVFVVTVILIRPG